LFLVQAKVVGGKNNPSEERIANISALYKILVAHFGAKVIGPG